MSVARNITLYPWIKFCQNLIFWQAVWFLFFQTELSAADAIILYAIYDIGTTVLEVPSGYLSDRLGRRITLLVSALSGLIACLLLVTGDSFAAFAVAQMFFGASAAFASGTDTALLYESLVAQGRAAEVEAQELRAWRFTFTALALSAVTGGVMSLWWPALPFLAAGLAFLAMFALCLRLVEPSRRLPSGPEVLRSASLRAALVHPVLIWLFVLSVLMYGYSHLPFVFGQPFILEALDSAGLAAEAPVVSGAVSSVMMLVSVAASLIALRLRRRIGLAAILLLAFAMQIGLAAVLAATGSAIAIAFLLLRMVPDSLSRPFILARIQPLLGDATRATYLSLKSLVGRLLFAGSLFLASGLADDADTMSHTDIQQILVAYVAVGLIALLALGIAVRRLPLEAR